LKADVQIYELLVVFIPKARNMEDSHLPLQHPLRPPQKIFCNVAFTEGGRTAGKRKCAEGLTIARNSTLMSVSFLEALEIIALSQRKYLSQKIRGNYQSVNR
jgi:hypothetical protein